MRMRGDPGTPYGVAVGGDVFEQEAFIAVDEGSRVRPDAVVGASHRGEVELAAHSQEFGDDTGRDRAMEELGFAVENAVVRLAFGEAAFELGPAEIVA